MRFSLILGGLLLLTAGCGKAKLNMDATFDVPLVGKTYVIDPSKREQTIKVTATASGGPIDIFVFLEKDRDEVEKGVMRKKLPASILAHALATEQADLEAVVPAKEAAVVMIQKAAAKKMNVALKIRNK